MKKINIFLASILFIAFASCDITDTPITLTVNNSITKSVDISVEQTNGTALALDARETVNLGDIVSNADDITDVQINSITYRFKNFSGNNAGVIESVLLKIDNVVLANETDINVFSEVENATIYQIVDEAKLTQLEDIFISNSETQLAIVGSVLSDAGTMDFQMEVSISLTVSLKN